ncbi:hypothetical protein M413DRAFT_23358 [Hebeloma cylindrosporum]|uniref:Uncharacterized protein n=1 Tax=Hebeloma cylindrosporum TaxID=76867 RepID=A0A0C3CSM4_HEBCY|nr:hypothetical protein M413DRAFT_23358 [Hebeloma cylindrosporum h7]
MSLIKDEVSLSAYLNEDNHINTNVRMQLISRHAHLFDGKNKEAIVFFALRTIEQRHQYERRHFLKRARKEGILAKSSKPGEVLDLTQDDSGSEAKNDDDVDQEKESGSEDESSASEYSSDEHLDEKESTRRLHPVPDRLSPRRRHHHNHIANNKRPSSALKRGLKKTRDQRVHAIEVQQFLRACQPPMDRHLQHFLDFGCNSSEFLRGMSLWAPKKRLATLKKILTGPEGESVATEMELAVIENHLETYFADEM